MDLGIQGKVAIVTGSSTGMGRATAELFAAEGARIAMCARSQEQLAQAAQEIRTMHNAEVFARACDVTDQSAVQSFVEAVVKQFGRVDILVANAGGPPAKNFLAISPDEWRKAIDLSFLSVVWLTRAAIPHMQRNQWGRIVTITSTSVKQPIPDLVLSNAVRASVVGLVKSLSNEFGRDGITVNNVGPGYTTTERLNELAGTRALAAGISMNEMYARWASELPLRRLGKPEEIASAVVWLCSQGASYVTGQTLLVDGGSYRGV